MTEQVMRRVMSYLLCLPLRLSLVKFENHHETVIQRIGYFASLTIATFF